MQSTNTNTNTALGELIPPESVDCQATITLIIMELRNRGREGKKRNILSSKQKESSAATTNHHAGCPINKHGYSCKTVIFSLPLCPVTADKVKQCGDLTEFLPQIGCIFRELQ